MRLSACADPAEGEQLLTEGPGFFDRRTGPQRQTLREGFEALEKRLSEPEKRQKYLPFGFSALDGRVWVYPGKFLILGGYPSSGKTALALNMAVSMSRSWRVGFYSLETDFPTVFNRLAAYVSGVKYAHIQDGELTEQEGETLRGILPLFPPTGLTVERASRLNVQTLQASALSQRYDVIFIDYLQLLESDLRRDASRYEQTTRVSMELHRFAQDRGVAVIALSQLSRPDKAQKKPRRPTMSDLRESGQLEQDADVVMILAQDAEDPDSGDRLLYIDKNKDGKLGGNVCRQEDMAVLTREAVAVAERTVEHMGRGEAEIFPYKDACKWCPYGSVCRFDKQQQGCYERSTKSMTVTELIEMAEKLK